MWIDGVSSGHAYKPESGNAHRAHRIVDWYSFFKDFAGPGATVTASITAAGVAGYFAYQQAKTAKRQAETALDQLRFNLFEKRYAMYEQVKELIDLVIHQGWRPGDDINYFAKAMQRCEVTIDEAVFFFTPTTCQWLESVRADCKALLDADWNRVQTAFFDEPDLHSFTSGEIRKRQPEEAALEGKLREYLKAMPKLFRDELSFRQLTDQAR